MAGGVDTVAADASARAFKAGVLRDEHPAIGRRMAPDRPSETMILQRRQARQAKELYRAAGQLVKHLYPDQFSFTRWFRRPNFHSFKNVVGALRIL